MKTLTNLLTQLQSREYHVRYPQLLDKTPKTHVLFLGPYNNATGFYRVIVPYFELNKTQTHSAIINQIIPNTSENRKKNTQWNLSDEMIQWADVIVFPTVTSDLFPIIKELKQVNRKKHLKFIMDIDDNYHVDSINQDNKVANESRKNLINNMVSCNAITCTNMFLANFYQRKIQEAGHKLPDFYIMQNMMYNACLEGIKITEPKPKATRMGIMLTGTETKFSDLFSVRKILLEAQKKYKDKLEIVLFGWSGKIHQKSGFKDALQGVKTTYVEPVDFEKYFNKLANLQLDFALMPLLETEFNKSKSHHKLLQYGQMGVPAIVSDVLPYKEILAPEGSSIFNKGYFPAIRYKDDETLLKAIDFMMENTEARKKIAEISKSTVKEYFTWDGKGQMLTQIYK